MNAEIIAVGSELLGSDRIDTDSLFVTDQLNALGVEVVQKTIIGDHLDRLARAINDSLSRCDMVILSGGLGPTEDDLTREAVASALGRKLVFDEATLQFLRERFARLKRVMAETNRRQAYLVEGAAKLRNSNGTAPGQWIENDGRIIILLPGPPRELEAIFIEECLPRLLERVPRQMIRTRFFRVAGMPESELDQLIAPAYKPYTNVVTTILAAAGDLQVHLRARCDTAEQAESLVEEAGARIKALLGDRIYSENGDALEVVAGGMLRARGATLAVAESFTGGLLAATLANVPGSSDYLVGGMVTYTAEQKIRLLGVDPALIEQYTVVSEPVAKAMAEGARQKTGATYALSTTGEAGPQSATPGVEPGTAWIGLATPNGAKAVPMRFTGGRNLVRQFGVQAALNLLRREL
ncbi:MAG: competence/damage-inducible protein A [Bryobacterales bacterium]|nr:competence/damage-inducible protein A [Bryobacterales bacterium]